MEITVIVYWCICIAASYGQSIGVSEVYHNSQVDITCQISPFSSVATWSNDGINVIMTCTNGGACFPAGTPPSYATFTANANGIYVNINPFDNSVEMQWICANAGLSNSTTLVYTSPETTTEEPITSEQSTIASSIISTDISHSTTIGSGKDSTEIVSITSAVQVTSTTASIDTEPKSVFVPLVISVSVTSCFVVIVAICVVTKSLLTKEKNTSKNYRDLNPSSKNDHADQRKLSNNQKEKFNKSGSRFISQTEYNPEISHYNHSHSRRNVPEQRSIYDNTICRDDGTREYRGHPIEMGNLPHAHFKNTHGGFS